MPSAIRNDTILKYIILHVKQYILSDIKDLIFSNNKVNFKKGGDICS